MNAGVIIFVLLLVLAFLGLPIYLSIGIATMVAMLHAGFPLEAVAQKTFLGIRPPCCAFPCSFWRAILWHRASLRN